MSRNLLWDCKMFLLVSLLLWLAPLLRQLEGCVCVCVWGTIIWLYDTTSTQTFQHGSLRVVRIPTRWLRAAADNAEAVGILWPSHAESLIVYSPGWSSLKPIQIQGQGIQAPSLAGGLVELQKLMWGGTYCCSHLWKVLSATTTNCFKINPVIILQRASLICVTFITGDYDLKELIYWT